MKDVLLPLGTLVVGWILGLFTEPARHWLMGPHVRIEVLNNEACVVRTPVRVSASGGVERGESYFVRVKVTNTGLSMARAARVYLHKIDAWRGNGFESTEFIDPIQCAWATRTAQDAFTGWDLPRNMPVFADVINTLDGYDGWKPQIQLQPGRLRGMYQERGKFRLHVVVSGDGFQPASCRIVLDWKGEWNTFKVHQE